MTCVYTVLCKAPVVATIQAALFDRAEVYSCTPSELATVLPPPDAVFVAMNSQATNWMDTEEQRCVRLAQRINALLDAVHKALGFRDVPLIVVAGEDPIQRRCGPLLRGVASVLYPPTEEEHVLQAFIQAFTFPGACASVNARLITPFIDATVNVFSLMAGVEARRRQVFLKRDYTLLGDVSAVLDLTGGGVQGVVGISFQEPLARDLVASMVRVPASALRGNEVHDGVAETVNMIAGSAKAVLQREHGVQIRIGLPRVVVGVRQEMAHAADAPSLAAVFEVAGRPFAVQVALEADPTTYFAADRELELFC